MSSSSIVSSFYRLKDGLNQLMGLSKNEIDRITPDTTDLRVYSVLIDIVKKTS